MARQSTRSTAKPRQSRIPALLVDLADAVSLDIEGGDTLQFSATGKWALCASRAGTELWIVSRKGAKRVRATDDRGERLYEKFTGFEHDDTGRMIQIRPVTLKQIGRAMNIVYRSDKFSTPSRYRKYIHAFRRYPIVSADRVKNPTILALRGGHIRIREEGITG